ncbi:hypothetical protein BC643_0755 [Mangrovibacterium diazotrophicum]|uniref:Uncharacterized protein n=2 Tax=Mangrovibacterium diazotrophicum TaxID=1261403 RepID=A0A419W4Q2_9BACT|nr:hypothetical protein BC643_0755 [Mangrovibacterium diazotrophicum]
MSLDEFLALKNLSANQLWDSLGEAPSFLHKSILKLIENNPENAESLIEHVVRLIFRLDEIKRIKFLVGYLILIKRSTPIDVILARRISNYLETIRTLESDLAFALRVTEDQLKEKTFHASEFYASSFAKRKKHIIFRMFIPNMTRGQIRELYNGLVQLKCIPGPKVTSGSTHDNMTYKKFTQLFYRDSRAITDWGSGKIPWIAVSSKNNQPNKKALLDLFCLLRDMGLVQKNISDLDLFNILEMNFCQSNGQDLTKFTHSNKGNSLNPKSELHQDFCRLVQHIT